MTLNWIGEQTKLHSWKNLSLARPLILLKLNQISNSKFNQNEPDSFLPVRVISSNNMEIFLYIMQAYVLEYTHALLLCEESKHDASDNILLDAFQNPENKEWSLQNLQPLDGKKDDDFQGHRRHKWTLKRDMVKTKLW